MPESMHAKCRETRGAQSRGSEREGGFSFKVGLLLMGRLLEKPVRFRVRGDGRAVRLIVYFLLCCRCLFL